MSSQLNQPNVQASGAGQAETDSGFRRQDLLPQNQPRAPSDRNAAGAGGVRGGMAPGAGGDIGPSGEDRNYGRSSLAESHYERPFTTFPEARVGQGDSGIGGIGASGPSRGVPSAGRQQAGKKCPKCPDNCNCDNCQCGQECQC